MLFSESFQMALTSLYANKMRSLLTMLGIIIGVAAVIALVSVGMGVRSNVTSSIASLGSNMLIISPGASQKGGVRGAAGSRKTLKYDDAKAIEQKIKNIDYVSPTVSSSYQVIYGNNNWNTSVQGVTPELLSIRSLSISNGSFITENDLSKRQRVAVIGTTVAENLFEDKNPVGQNIRINNQPFKVVGLLESKGQSSMGQDQDDMIYIPLTTAMERMLGITYVQSINVQVSDATKMDQVQDEIETLLRQRHQLVLRRFARGPDAGDDAAAGTGHFFVAGPGQAHGELVGTLAAIDQVGVAVDQARRGQAPCAIMPGQRLVFGGHGILRAHPDHAALLHHDTGQRALGNIRHFGDIQLRRQTQVVPAAVGRDCGMRNNLRHGDAPSVRLRQFKP